MSEERTVSQIIFDEAMKLKAGDKLEVPFETLSDLKSKRTMIFLEKRRFEAETGTSIPLFATQNSEKLTLTLSLRPLTVSCLEGMKIINSEGEKETPLVKSNGPSALEIQRIRSKMAEDGLSEEEIEDYLKEL